MISETFSYFVCHRKSIYPKMSQMLKHKGEIAHTGVERENDRGEILIHSIE